MEKTPYSIPKIAEVGSKAEKIRLEQKDFLILILGLK